MPVLEFIYMCVCACVLCVYACYIGHTIIRLFLRKLAKRANICACFSLPFFPQVPLLHEHSSVASSAYAFFITYTYTCWIPLRLHSLPTTPAHHSLSFPSFYTYLWICIYVGCVVCCAKHENPLPLTMHPSARHAAATAATFHMPLATAPLTAPPPCWLCLASVLARLQQVPIKMLSIFALLTFQRNNGRWEACGKCPDKCCRYSSLPSRFYLHPLVAHA